MLGSSRSILGGLRGRGNGQDDGLSQNRADYKKYIDDLRLSEGQALSPVNQIYCPLIEKLWCGAEFSKHLGAQFILTSLKAGQLFSPAQSIVDFAKQINVGEKDPTLKKLHDLTWQAHEDYVAYCHERYLGFHDILSQYNQFRYRTSLGAFMWRWYKGRSYRGKFANDTLNLDFIKLIDQISLLDREGNTVPELLKALEKHEGHFDYAAQSEFLNSLYSRLLQFQKGFFYERAVEDEKELRRLRKYFGISQGSSIDDELIKYYYFIVYNKKPLGAKNPVPPQPVLHTLEQFIFDVHQTRDQREKEKEDFTARIKDFKKNIHHVAQGLGLPSRLRKTSELFDEFLAAQAKSLQQVLQRKENRPLSETTAIEQLQKTMTNRLNNKYQPSADEFDEQKSVTAEDKEALDQAFATNVEQLAKCLHIEKQQQDEKWNEDKYIERIKQELETVYRYEYDLALCKHIISKDQKEKRAQQQWNDSVSSKTAKVTSVGEACVAASQISMAIVLGSPLVILLAVLYCAYYINNLLFRGDSRSVLDALLLKKKVMVDGVEKEYRLIYLDSEGNPLSSKAIWGIRILGSLSFATGVIYGALSFLSSYVTLPQLFTQIGISSLLNSHLPIFLTILQIGGSAIPAVGMAIAITCIFYKVIADFIREKRYESIKNYFKVNFQLKNGNETSAFWGMKGTQQCLHILKCTGRVLILACAVAVTVAVTVLSAGCFYKDTLKILNFAAHWDPWSVFATAMVGINGGISSPFQVDGTNRVIQPDAGFKFSESVQEELDEEDRQTMPSEKCQLVTTDALPATPQSEGPRGAVSETEASFSASSGASPDSNVEISISQSRRSSTPDHNSPEQKDEKESPMLFEKLSSLLSSNIGYIHLLDEQKLYYIDKSKEQCVPVEMTADQLTKFDAQCKRNLPKTSSPGPLLLAPNSRALNKIIGITGHTPEGSLSPMQKDAQKIFYIKKFEAAVTSAGNGIGYAYATIGSGTNNPAVSGVGTAVGAAYSGFPNYNAAVNTAQKEFFASSLFSVDKTLQGPKEDGPAAAPRWRTSLAVR